MITAESASSTGMMEKPGKERLCSGYASFVQGVCTTCRVEEREGGKVRRNFDTRKKCSEGRAEAATAAEPPVSARSNGKAA